MRHLRLSIIAVALVLGCASGGATPAGTEAAVPDQTVRVIGAGTSVSVTGRDPSVTHAVPYAPDAVFRMLPPVFDELGIPVLTLDGAKRIVANESFSVRRKLKNVSLNKYIDCGTGSMGPNAENYDVKLSLSVKVSAGEAGGSKVVTTLEAAAKPANYSQGFTSCTSRGELEAKLVDLVKAKLTR